jgi:Arc/MetJ-type ribon-helix-helix transcriptional regulator
MPSLEIATRYVRLESKGKDRMTIHLPTNLESSILAAVHSGRYATLDDAMAEAASLLLERLKQEQVEGNQSVASQASPAHKSIWEVFQEISASVPKEVWESLPTDLSERHDHFVYGTPKRPAE